MAANAQRREREQITVPVSSDLRATLERVAQSEHRSVASLVRHVLATALEHRTVSQREAVR